MIVSGRYTLTEVIIISLYLLFINRVTRIFQETGHLPGAPDRDYHMNIADEMLEYAPTAGLTELREKVANYYNQLYRQEKESKYTYENVCVVPGGRAGLTRVMAALGRYVHNCMWISFMQ